MAAATTSSSRNAWPHPKDVGAGGGVAGVDATVVVVPPPEILSPTTMQKSASTAPSAMRPLSHDAPVVPGSWG